MRAALHRPNFDDANAAGILAVESSPRRRTEPYTGASVVTMTQDMLASLPWEETSPAEASPSRLRTMAYILAGWAFLILCITHPGLQLIPLAGLMLSLALIKQD